MHVLITGGSRGLGLLMARQLAADGARLTICARDQAELERAREGKSEFLNMTVPIDLLPPIFEDLRRRTGNAAIGAVGLGAGTIAAYAQPGDQLTFFEINPAVAEIARNPAYFTYLTDAAVVPRIVVGDGRLSLEGEPAAACSSLHRPELDPESAASAAQ